MMLRPVLRPVVTCLCLLQSVLLLSVPAEGGEFQHPVRVRGVTASLTLDGEIQVGRTFDRGKITVRLLLFPDTPHQTVHKQQAVIQGPGPDMRPDRIINEKGNRYAIFHLTRPGSYHYQLTANIKTDRHPSTRSRKTETLSLRQRERFTASTKHIQTGDEQIKFQSGQLLKSDRFLENLHRVTRWVHDHVQYDRQFYPQTISASEVIRKKRGVCDEFSALAGALMRSGNIPVRFVSGVVFSGSSWGNHAWMEAFHPDSGWTPVDPTYQEATVLDGTHIRRGHFDDPEGNSLSVRVQARSSNVSNIRIDQHEPDVDLRETQTFTDLIDVDARDVTFPAKRWVSLEARVDNQVSSTVIVPVLLRRVNNMKIKNRTTSLLINGGQSGTVRWDLRMNRKLPDRARLTGTYELITMAEPVRPSFEVYPEPLTDASPGLVYDGGSPAKQGKETVSATRASDRDVPLDHDRPGASKKPRTQHERWIPDWIPASWNLERFSPASIMYALIGMLGFILAVLYMRRN